MKKSPVQASGLLDRILPAVDIAVVEQAFSPVCLIVVAIFSHLRGVLI
ncbi:MAG: hypothetical protein JOZ62_17425 [Acidobacteriaceae bacterium]|nr:hypothetical protein [Acidobacteriaceae bacterium]